MSSHGRLSKEVVGSDVLLWRDHPGTCETLGRKAWAMSMKFHWINKEVWQRETHTHPSLSLVKMTNSDSWGVAYLGQAELASWASQMEYPQAVLFSQFIYLLIFFFFESSQFIIHWIGSCRAFFSFVFIYSLLSSFRPAPQETTLICLVYVFFFASVLGLMNIFLIYISAILPRVHFLSFFPSVPRYWRCHEYI